MSKTKRRKKFGFGKGKRNYFNYIFYEYDWRTSSYIPKSDEEISSSINKFHSDKSIGDNWRVPSWFRRDRERNRRTKMNEETRRILRTGEYDNYNYEPVKRTIQWEWW